MRVRMDQKAAVKLLKLFWLIYNQNCDQIIIITYVT
jgi:hypothetical protein